MRLLLILVQGQQWFPILVFTTGWYPSEYHTLYFLELLACIFFDERYVFIIHTGSLYFAWVKGNVLRYFSKCPTYLFIQTVDKSDQHPFGPPVPGAPLSRQTFPTPQTTWSIDGSVVPINRGELIRRVTRYSSIPYGRSFHRPIRMPPNSVTNSRSPTWRNARRGCIERIHFELSATSVMTAEVVQQDLRRVVEEKDAFREKLEVFSLKASLSSMSSFSGNCTEFVQVFSSAGPLRRNSISRSLLRTEPVSSGYPRCKTADPYLLPRGVNDCFDVTLVGRSLPPQRDYRRVTNLESSSLCLTRDASHPHKELSQHYPLSKMGEIDFDYVDILYIPYNGRVFCRACQ